jgi:hypothetical protein
MINQMHDKQLKILRAYIDRRNRLWAQIKAANPTYTQFEVEARLEQFGA